ncbi:MAG TPA: glycosyltransferase family 9 protein [Acidobacteriota bacterium]|nr:glycosyltransferase family 9 protein [Acidobacteriota bacterium]
MSQAQQPKMLFIRLRSLGDTVLMTPCLEVARRAGYRTAVLVEAPFDAILEEHPHLDDLFVLPRKGKSWMNRLAMLRRLRDYRADIAVDLHGGSTAALMTRWSAALSRVGYASSRHRRSYDVAAPDSRLVWGRQDIHTAEHQLAPLKHLGLPADPPPDPLLPVRPRARAEVDKLLAEAGLAGRSFALIHPAAAFDTKQWDARRFAAVGDRLQQRLGIPVAVTAGPGEEPLIEQVASSMESPPTRVPPQALDRFAALAARCAIYLGNDTGPMHMAAAFKRPVVAVFGSSDWRVWHPWRTPHRLIKADLSCIPCPGYTCHLYEEPRCIRSIGVERVWEAVKELVEST